MYIKGENLYFEEVNDFGDNKPIPRGPAKPSVFELSDADEDAVRAVKKLQNAVRRFNARQLALMKGKADVIIHRVWNLKV